MKKILILISMVLLSCQTNENNDTNTTSVNIDSLKIVDAPIDELPIIVVEDASLVLPKQYKEITDSTDWADVDESIEFLKQNCPARWDEARVVLVDIFDAAYKFPNGKKIRGKACELVIFFSNDDDSKSIYPRVGIGEKFKVGKHRFKLLELYTGNHNYRNRPIKAKIQKIN